MADNSEKTQLSPIKQALLEIRRLRGKLDEVEHAKTEPIAVIGIGMRYPGGADQPGKFWHLVRDGVDAVTEVPTSRWDIRQYYDPDPDAPAKMYVRRGGFLIEDVTQFEPTFFGISPREAQNLDPQQRLLLEVSWEALENAGLAADQLLGSRTGVFVGIGGNPDYMQSLIQNIHNIDAYAGPGTTNSAAAGRLSYFYGFKGPAMSVDTACSSSLVTTHLACHSLRSRESDMALVGGVTMHLNPLSFINQCKLRMTSPDGRSKAFDASGNGVGRGEGCGIIVLKRLSDAIADGDNILALIRGSAVNQDGRTSGLTAPNGPSQQDVIRRALASAGIEPHEVSYLEAHGTGTPLGDPIEIQAAATVYGVGRPADKPLLTGSVKTNIGHLEEGAGVASLIKVILALQNEEIPPSLHYDNPNPYILWDQLPVKVNTTLTPWPAGDKPRFAGISSFGWSGTNAHIVLQEAPPIEITPVTDDRPQHLLTMSARNEKALSELAARYETYLGEIETSQISFADVCFTANTGRSLFPQRLGIVAATAADARKKLADFGEGKSGPGIVHGKTQIIDQPQIAFLFTGQGSQYIGMGRQLYETEPVFREALDTCHELSRPYLDVPLLSLLYPENGESPIDETAYTQPAIFALEYALAVLWRSWGIEPAIVTGHSVGEYVAACIAGVFSLEDGLRLIAERGRLMQTLPKGGVMFNIFAKEERVKEALAPYKGEVSIAALNGPEIVVISGAKEPVEEIVNQLRKDEIRAWPLAVSHALHTSGMEPILEKFEELASTITYTVPKIKMVSMLTGDVVEGEEIATATYWRRHMREAVRFSDAIITLHKLGYETYLEIGPDPKLSTMGQLCVPKDAGIWIPSLRQNRNEWQQMLESVGMFYVAGIKVDWKDIDRIHLAQRRRLQLPTYPFQRQSFWYEASEKRDSSIPSLTDSVQTPILNLLHYGDTEKLIQELKKSSQFSEDDMMLAPKLLDILIKQHQQQVTTAAINEWLYEIAWQAKPSAANQATLPEGPGNWLIFADQQGVGLTIAKQLKAQGKRCLLVYPGTTYELTSTDQWQVNPTRPEDFVQLLQEAVGDGERPFQGVVHLWSLSETDSTAMTSAELEAAVAVSNSSVLHLVQALEGETAVTPQLWLVTRGAQPVAETETLAVAQAPLWGLGNVIRMEHPDLHCAQIDLDPVVDAATNGQTLFAEIAGFDQENGVAFRKGTRYVSRLVRSTVASTTENGDGQHIQIEPNASYLITGGMGGLGLVVARWLADQGARYLVLMGRSAPSAKVQAVIRELEEAGTQVMIGQADVAQAEQVAAVLAQIDAAMPPLRGIVHAAGTLDDGVLLQQEWERFTKVMAPKIAGTWNLHTLTQNRPLDFFLMFSSIAATLGSPGQGNYAAANTFMDAMAHYRHEQGLPALSINWGGWTDVGMAATLDSQNNQRWAAIGVGLITPDQGVQTLTRLLQQDLAQMVVLPVQWPKFMQQFIAGQEPPFLTEMAAAVREQEPVTPLAVIQSALMQRLEAARASERPELLLAHVREQAAQVLGLDDPDALDPETPLRDLGMDSLMAVQLRNLLSESLARPLPATLMFNYPTIGDVADYLSREVLAEIGTPASPVAAPPTRVIAADEPIAIIGMSARFPGADSVDAFWELLQNGVDAITEVPADRWPVDGYYDAEPGAPGKMYTRWGGFLKDVDLFDTQFFGISPREAVTMDPQQRLLLEASWQALEHAGQSPARMQGSQTGVFVGIGNYDYAQLQLKRGDPKKVGTYSGSGNSLSMAAGRLSYVLGLQGPSMAVDTACSSSLVALHLACQSLHDGECDAALAGGVNLILAPEPTVALSQAQMMANDGRCKTFDAAANGFVRSEGCGIVVLKRLSDAVAAGDNILALIRGTAINQDGRSQGLTAPNGLAQEAVIRQALARAGMDPAQISYVEAHGTGTSLGDPIEVGALGAVYGAGRSADENLLIGSVKTNIGHMENAAGIGSLIKVVLSLQNEMIPPHLHFRQPSPFIPWDELPIEVVAAPKPWPTGNGRRVAGVSSFGFSGTNAHVIIEEAPVHETATVTEERPFHLFTLSARSESALQELAQRYQAYLVPTMSLADICYTANAGRSHFHHRLAIAAESTTQLQEALTAFINQQEAVGVTHGEAGSSKRKVAFLFTGQGSQYVDMGKQLYETQPTFRAALDKCDELLRSHLEQPLLTILYPGNDEEGNPLPSPIDETMYTQPALFAIEYALAQLWISWGIEPTVMMGHSVGEYVAACIAGVFSLEDGLKLIAERGRQMQALPETGTMAAIFTTEDRVRAAIAPYQDQVSIAAINGATNIVISGSETAVSAVMDTMTNEHVKVRQLVVSHAFHSPLMDPMLDTFAATAASITYGKPKIDLISNVTGQLVNGDEVSHADYWRQHVREAVRFKEGMEALHQQGYDLFIEVGPNPTLLGMGRRNLHEESGVWLPSLRHGKEEWPQLLNSLAQLYVLGMEINWVGFDQDYARQRLPLPTYSFQRQRYWFDAADEDASTANVVLEGEWSLTTGHPLLGQQLPTPLPIFQTRLTTASQPYLSERHIHGLATLPETVCMEIALAAATQVFGTGKHALTEMRMQEIIALPETKPATIQAIVTPAENGSATFQLFSLEENEANVQATQELVGAKPAQLWRLHASGKIAVNVDADVTPTPISLAEVQARCQQNTTGTIFYEQLAEKGLAYGPHFQGIQQLWQGNGETLGQIRLPDAGASAYHLHPVILEAGLQLLYATLLHENDGGEAETAVYLPISLGQIHLYTRPDSSIWGRAVVQQNTVGQEVVTGDLFLFNETGQILAELTGVQLKRIQQQALQPLLQQRFHDWLYEVAWQPKPRIPESKQEQPGNWLIFADSQGVGAAIALQLEGRGAQCSLIYPGESYARLDSEQWQINPAQSADFGRLLQEVSAGKPLRGIVHLWSLTDTNDTDLDATTLHDAQALTNGSTLHLVQALVQTRTTTGRLWLVTRGAQAINKADVPAIAQAPLWGLGHVIALEHPDLRCTRLDLDPNAAQEATVRAFFDEVWQPDSEDRIAFRHGGRYAARLVRSQTPAAENSEQPQVQIQADATYVISGGMGALGLLIARWLVKQGARHLVLLGRRSPSAKAQAVIDTLESAGAQVLIGQADVAKAEELAQVLTQVGVTMPPLRGIIHAAGVLDDGVILQQEWSRFDKVMAPKVAGTWNLHTLTKEMPLDFFILFSSSAALFGSPGQSNYAAANAFMDAFAYYRQEQGLPALSINWGGWADVGMAAGVGSQNNQRWAAMGVELIVPEQGVQVLDQLLSGSTAQMGVFPIRWATFVQQFGGLVPPFLAEMARSIPQRETAVQTTTTAQPAFMQQLEAALVSERRDLLLAHVRSQALRTLALDPTHTIAPDRPLLDLGLDSLMAVELRNALSTSLGRPLPATLLFDYPTIGALTDYLSKEVLAGLTEAQPPMAVAPTRAVIADEPIAIIGMSGRFPGANSIEAYWELLRDSVDAIREVPDTRWNAAAYFDPEPGAPGKMYTRWGGFIEGADQFDPQFFGISPREAMAMDPQQRLLLEVSWEALENAGLSPSRMQGSETGVFVGIGNYDYSQLQAKEGNPDNAGSYSGTGNALSVAAGRLSYVLGLQGPSMAVDTACSSSLVALHLACQSLHDGECDAALACGVNLILSPEISVVLSQSRMMSADGRCKTFDAAADGYVRGEGCGTVVLKRLSDAVADGDHILALIRGTAINQDGRSQGLTAPNGVAQEAVIRRALAKAGVKPGQVNYVETHGTGTSLGDPIEVGALGAVYGQEHTQDNKLVIGSVKTNIGHLETAAGMASLIKVILSLQHETIPSHLHFHQPSPFIPWNELPIEVPTSSQAWPAGDKPRMAGVSSFGFSGTNAHAIIEEAPIRLLEPAPQERPSHIFTLSAKDTEALSELAARYETVLPTAQGSLADVCHTVNVGRSHFAHRLAVVADDMAALQQKLAAFREGKKAVGVVHGEVPGTDARKIAFLFTGQGSQYVDMGRQLYETQPVFRATLDKCDELLRPYLDQPLLSVLYPGENDKGNPLPSPIDETAYTQPALFAIEYALAQLWRSWGIEPSVVMGHSIGEYVAACVAGMFSLEDGLRLIAERGRLMQSLPQDGAMTAVFTTEERLNAALASYQDQVSIAAVNGAQNIVISGAETAVHAITAELEQEGITTRPLVVSHAFHSPLMEPILDMFEAVAASVAYVRPKIGVVSNVTGQLVKGSEMGNASYWRQHVRKPVRFAEAITTLQAEGYDLFVEIGPNPALLAMGKRCWPDTASAGDWLPSLRKGRDDWRQMLGSLTELYTLGMEVDWVGFDQDYARQRLALPTYPFQHRRYWFEVAETGIRRSLPASATAVSPLLGQRLSSALKDTQYEVQLSAHSPSFLAHRQLHGHVLLPEAIYMEMGLAAAADHLQTKTPVVRNLIVKELPPALDATLQTIQVILTPAGASTASFEIFGLLTGAQVEPTWQLLATGEAQAGSASALPSPIAVAEIQERSQVVEADDYYAQLAAQGLFYGERLQVVTQLWQGDGEALARLKPLDDTAPYQLHPTLLDGCSQLAVLEKTAVYTPTNIAQIQVYNHTAAPVWCYAQVREENAAGVTGDLHLLDEAGQLVAKVAGIHLKQMTPETLQTPTADLSRWLYEIEWQNQPHQDIKDLPSHKPGRWLILADTDGVGDGLAERLTAQGETCLIVRPQTNNQAPATADRQVDPTDAAAFHTLLHEMMDDAERPFRGAIHLWGLDLPAQLGSDTAVLTTATELGTGSALHLIQALITAVADFKPEVGVEQPRLWLVTRAAQSVDPTGESVVSLAQSPLWGLGKTIALEQFRHWGGLYDLDPTASPDEAAQLFTEIWHFDNEQQVAFRQGQRYVARLIQNPSRMPRQQALSFRPDGAYLISGGLGGLGLEVAHWLANQGARRLILLGRTPLPPRNTWRHIEPGSRQASQIKAVQELEAMGTSVHTAALDVGDAAQLHAFLTEYEEEGWSPIRGVVHAAGLLRDNALLQVDMTSLHEVFRPKVLGGWLLHQALQDKPLDFFVMFSSAASLVGSTGQANYAAANAFLEALAYERRRQGQPALSINWGPWAEVGMAAQANLEARRTRLGMDSIMPEQGVDLLGRFLWQDIAQIGIMPFTPAQLHQLSPGDSSFLADLSIEQLVAETDAQVEGSIGTRIREAPATERMGLLLAHLSQRISQLLMVDAGTISVDRNMMELGLDSIMIMELIQKLDRDLHLTLYPNEIFERPSVSALAEYLLAELERVGGTRMATAMNTLVGSAAQTLTQPLERNSSMIFLLSTPRAGSTLLRVMLAGHSKLFSPPELHLLLFNSMAERDAGLGHSLLSKGLQRAMMELMDLDDQQSQMLLAEWVEQDLSTQEAYRRLQELANPRILVDKSPSYAMDINVLERAETLFTDAKYIHLVRHPYAVIDSLVRNRLDKMYDTGGLEPAKFAEQLWATYNSNLLDFLEDVDPERHHLVSYEELVTDPEKVLKELCDFMGIPFEAAMLNPYEGNRMKDKSVTVGDVEFFKYKGVDPNQATSWRHANLPRRLGGFARRIAAELDYELPWPLEPAIVKPEPAAVPQSLQPVTRNGELPLSFAQQRLVFIDLLEPGMPMYNIPLAVRLRGDLQVEALKNSLNEIVQRHEVLRANFTMVDGAAQQEISTTATVPWHITDLRTVPDVDQDDAVRRLMAEEVQKPFNLAEDVKMRAELLRLHDDDHILILTMHHIASDGWSIGVLLRELTALYEAFAASQPSPLPSLPIQYADYAYWQREWLQGDVLRPALTYWKQQLSGVSVLELPTDRPRPPLQTYNGDRLILSLTPELTTALKTLSQKEGVTLFMTLLAAFQALLHRYSGQGDIAVGTPISGRNQQETKDLIGFFLNTLVMRTDLSDNPSFRDLLKRVRQVSLAAYEHQDLPFDKLVEELQPERNLSHSPLFQVMFTLNLPMSGPQLANLDVTHLVDIPTGKSTFDLFLMLRDTPGGLTGWIEFNTDLFDIATIERMADHLQMMLTAVTDTPEQHVANIPLLTAAEREQLLVTWNDTELDYPRDTCLHQLVEASAAAIPNTIAVIFDEEKLTYRELNERANQLAHHLQKLGVGPDKLVGLYVDRSLDMVVGLLGVLKAGGAYVPLDPAFPADRLAYMLADSQAAVLLTQESLKESLIPENKIEILCLDSDWPTIAQQSVGNPSSEVQPHHLAYVIYTSGSTGKPKGVQLQHQGVVNFLTTMRQEPGLTAEDVLLSVTTLSFDISVLEVFLPLTTGACLVVASRETSADGLRLMAEMERTGTTVMQATPATWRLLIESGWSGKSDLKILCGGEALPRNLADQLLERCASLWNMYGPTETTIWSATIQVLLDGEAITIGRPIGNTQCYVLDAQLQPVPIGVPGELHIGGDGLARGYLNRLELTNEKFIPDPFRNEPTARLYKTGDQVRYLPNGNIQFLGRIDHQVKVRGFRIELGEIESVLIQHPAVQMSVVMAREDVAGDKRLVAYIIPEPGQEPTIGDLRRFLREALPDYMVPSNFMLMDVFPLTPNGKVNRRALPAPEGGRPELESTYVAPQAGIEETVATLWKEVLKIEKVGVNDNFFELGGHSLLLAQVHSKLQKQLDIQLPIIKLFQHPTISTLTKYLNQEQGAEASYEHVDERAERQKAALARQRQRARKAKGSKND